MSQSPTRILLAALVLCFLLTSCASPDQVAEAEFVAAYCDVEHLIEPFRTSIIAARPGQLYEYRHPPPYILAPDPATVGSWVATVFREVPHWDGDLGLRDRLIRYFRAVSGAITQFRRESFDDWGDVQRDTSDSAREIQTLADELGLRARCDAAPALHAPYVMLYVAFGTLLALAAVGAILARRRSPSGAPTTSKPVRW